MYNCNVGTTSMHILILYFKHVSRRVSRGVRFEIAYVAFQQIALLSSSFNDLMGFGFLVVGSFDSVVSQQHDCYR